MSNCLKTASRGNFSQKHIFFFFLHHRGVGKKQPHLVSVTLWEKSQHLLQHLPSPSAPSAPWAQRPDLQLGEKGNVQKPRQGQGAAKSHINPLLSRVSYLSLWYQWSQLGKFECPFIHHALSVPELCPHYLPLSLQSWRKHLIH